MTSYRLQFERFPFPPYSDDEFIVAISQQLPLVILLSFVYIGVQAAKNIAIEKESRLKERAFLKRIASNPYHSRMNSILGKPKLRNICL